MAFIPTPNAARVVLSYALGDQVFSNVLHCTKAGFTSGDMATLAADMDDNIADQWMPNIPSDITYLSTQVYDIRTSDGELVLANTETRVGGGGSDAAPINLAVVITLRTAARGRSGRGRLYVGGLDEGYLENGELNAAGNTLFISYPALLSAIFGDNGWTWVIRSTQQDGVQLSVAVTRPIVGWEIRSNRLGTQRRRVDRP